MKTSFNKKTPVAEYRRFGECCTLVLTVEPALLLAEAGPEEGLAGARGQVVEEGRQAGDDEGPAPGVGPVEPQSQQLLALLQARRSQVPANKKNKID